MRDVAEGVTLTYNGKGWSPSLFPLGAGDDLTIADLLDKLSTLRSVEARIAAAAVRSVANNSEMLGVEPMFEDKEGTYVELPASYQDDPPTDEVAAFIALHEAIAFVEALIIFKTKELYRDSEGIYDDGMIETRSEHSDRKWAEVAAATLDGLTGTFGGVIGYAISSYLTSDPEVIAAATQFGESAVGAVGAVTGIDPVTGAKKKDRGSTPKKGRKGGKGKRGSKGKKSNAPRAGNAKRRPKAVGLPSWKDMQIDMDHIVSGHTKGGDRERVSGKKSVFPEGMTPDQEDRR